jgi:predicted RND superfamily exporter protein
VSARPPGAPAAPALALALAVSGGPIVGTTVTVAVGFGAFALSPFRPTRDFGALMALTSVTALACVLTLMPALLLAIDRARGREP